MPNAIVVGAGLAGCEAALQLAYAGIEVVLYEMKPQRMSIEAKRSLSWCAATRSKPKGRTALPVF